MSAVPAHPQTRRSAWSARSPVRRRCFVGQIENDPVEVARADLRSPRLAGSSSVRISPAASSVSTCSAVVDAGRSSVDRDVVDTGDAAGQIAQNPQPVWRVDRLEHTLQVCAINPAVQCQHPIFQTYRHILLASMCSISHAPILLENRVCADEAGCGAGGGAGRLRRPATLSWCGAARRSRATPPRHLAGACPSNKFGDKSQLF